MFIAIAISFSTVLKFDREVDRERVFVHSDRDCYEHALPDIDPDRLHDLDPDPDPDRDRYEHSLSSLIFSKK